MSEYQYYEFRAVDRSLTREEMAELRKLSTRAEITPTSFTNTYNYGDFGGDELKVVERYFDAFLYVANWGTRQLMLRLPRQTVDLSEIKAYLPGEYAKCHEAGEHVIVELLSREEDVNWEEGEGWLTDILPVREALIRGDNRALYIAWLLEASQIASGEGEDDEDEDDDEDDEDYSEGDEGGDSGEDGTVVVKLSGTAEDLVEPPVPPGLGKLSPALERLAEFLRVDQDLLAVAAEHSAKLEQEGLDEAQLRRWVESLPLSEKDELLFRAARGEASLGLVLQRRFTQERRGSPRPSLWTPRTASQLMELAKRHAERRRRREAEQAVRERNRQLDALAPREAETWRKVEALIEEKQARPYEEAVRLLVDLRDLAAREGRWGAFVARIREMHARYKTRSGLLSRLYEAKLTERPSPTSWTIS